LQAHDLAYFVHARGREPHHLVVSVDGFGDFASAAWGVGA